MSIAMKHKWFGIDKGNSIYCAPPAVNVMLILGVKFPATLQAHAQCVHLYYLLIWPPLISTYTFCSSEFLKF